MIYDLSYLITAVVLLISSINDVISRKISNYITIPAFFAGIVLTVLNDPKELIIKTIFAFIYFYIGSFRIIGLGDVKLLIALTYIYGVQNTSYIFLGAVVVLFIYCLITKFQETKRMIKNTVDVIFYKAKLIVYSKEKYPFAVFLSISFILYECVRRLL